MSTDDDDVVEALIAYPAKSFPYLDFYEEMAVLRTAELFENKELVYNKTREQFEEDFKQRIIQATHDKSAFFQVYLEDNKPLGVVTLFVRQEYVHVYELQVMSRKRYQGIAKKLLRNAEGKFPGRIFYGVVHKSNPMLHAYLKYGCSECPIFHQEEHPQWRKEDGWISLVYPSLANEKETPLNRLQSAVGLEAIQDISGIARPVFLIRDDAVVNEPEKWAHVGNKSAIDQTFVELNKKLHCIGAVETRRGTLIGTCWLIRTGFVCTNRHVAEECYNINPNGEVTGTIQTPMVNFKREHDRPEDPAHRFTVEKLVYVDPDVDLAIFKLQDYTGTDYLVVEDAPFDVWQNLVEDEVFVIGYPGRDATRNPEKLMIKIFGQIYEKKRLAFGKLMDYKQKDEFYHNASTLGGNSGSPILGTSSLRVLGLHFGGAYNDKNVCVGYPKLQEILAKITLS